MNTYSQNKEDLIVKEYFKDRTGTLLSVGENDGTTFSNARLLIENGWSAHLFEPGSVCEYLIALHKGNDQVHVYNKGLSDKISKAIFYASGAHVKNGTDTGLVSTTNKAEADKWGTRGVKFRQTEIQLVDFKGWHQWVGAPQLNFITIDTEGHDWTILQQIDLGLVGCEFMVIEWNGDKGLAKKFIEYCGRFGLRECGRNSENLMFCL